MFADEFLLVVALMDVTDIAAIQDSAFSTGFLVFDQVKIDLQCAGHVEDLL